MEMLLKNDIVPGQRIVCSELAEQLGVSRTPISFGLCMLAQDGYLDFHPNRGYVVHQLSRKETESLQTIRVLIETETISKAIRIISTEKLDLLEKQNKEMTVNILEGRFRKFIHADMDFHLSLISSAGNDYLMQHYKNICLRLAVAYPLGEIYAQDFYLCMSQHQDLLKAIRKRNVENARKVTRRHHFITNPFFVDPEFEFDRTRNSSRYSPRSRQKNNEHSSLYDFELRLLPHNGEPGMRQVVNTK